MKKVMRHKETGNECFKTKAWQQAAKHYKEGLGHAKQLTEAPGYTEENDGAEVRALKVSLLLNLAQAWTKLDNQDQVLKCATDALAIDPVSPKALFRRAVVLEQRKDFDGAKADLKLAIQQPGAEKDKLITTLLQRVDIQIQRAKDKEKKMYGKMFS
jgi:tetratricopeptide (TPR) repeat protein